MEATPLPPASQGAQGPSPLKVSPEPGTELYSQSEDFRRSVTIVFWFKANAEPIRLQQLVPSFPYFSLSSFPTLVADLGLNPTSYLDTYNAKSVKWEQQTPTAVRLVESHQRLLYRVRKSLLEGLADTECLSLEDELASQQKPSDVLLPTPTSTKRPASEAPEGAPPTKIQYSTRMLSFDQTTPFVQIAATDSKSQAPHPPPPLTMLSSTGQSISVPLPAQQTPGQHLTNPGTALPATAFQGAVFASPDGAPLPPPPISALGPASTTIPYRAHPPLKRWPNDYTVAEVADGFRKMDLLVSPGSSGGPGITQRAAFEKVFGSRYVKSTVCRHRSVWRKASQTVKDQFEKMGDSEQACWGEFVRKVEGREVNRIIVTTGNPQTGLQVQQPAQALGVSVGAANKMVPVISGNLDDMYEMAARS
ncbi:hypothetical protein BDN72DRAFT_177899 [Pluteus cervinus]|uniref:Uncharacterized protein n=1 Tax=Pluteus cervinus TaxID=181527 RepID=A0ACD3AJY1_9AGAR|nr:hypothetical protein BDN72DRAFT_177899 [Pluteus cervinus]